MKNNSSQNKKEKLKEYKQELVDIFVKAGESKQLMGEFVVDIMTPAELDTISLRWQAVKKLSKGEPHRTIAGDLGLGISTVTRGSRELRNKNGGFAQMLKKIKT